MAIQKRKKNSRQRGTHTHGWGAKKKHRGAGHRGGRGAAGTGKRGDAKKPSIWKDTKYFGKHGFKKKGIKEKIKSISISVFEEKLEELLNKKLITKENDVYVIDCNKLGFNKLLSQGNVTKKYKIAIKFASAKTIEKIKKSGGEVILTKKNGSV